MHRAATTCLLLVVLVATAGPAVGSGDTPSPEEPQAGENATIVRALPNPHAYGDDGESLTVVVPAPGKYALEDGEGRARFTAAGPGRHVLTSNVSRARQRARRHAPRAASANARYHALPATLALANAGERLVLSRNGTVVDSLAYRDAPEGAVLRPGPDGAATWRPLGATDFPVRTAGTGTVTAFVLPDGAGVPAATLASADERIRLAGYTLTSRRVARRLIAARTRGVDVGVLVDGDPVGGVSRRQADILTRLAAAGVRVRVVGGPRAPVSFHHAKYAVVDGTALVVTENWKPAGTGGHSSRGWGVRTNQSGVVTALTETFRADAHGAGSVSWEGYRDEVEVQPAETAEGRRARRFSPEQLPVEGARVLVAPDNAEAAMLTELRRANESLRVLQMTVGSRRQPFLREAVGAAERGVEVRVLLSSARYVEAENRRVVQHLRAVADRRDLPLRAKLADPKGRFEKVHAKGVIVDGERVVLGSLNWNNHSARENREVALVLEGEAVAGYFERVFRADWRGGLARLPVGLVLVVALSWLVAAWRGRRIRFDEGPDPPGAADGAVPGDGEPAVPADD